MKKVTIKKAKNDLVRIFGAVKDEEYRKRKEHLSWYHETKDGVIFFIDNNYTERGEVLDILHEYFKERIIKGGYCTVKSITFVWTTFELKEGEPNIL